MLPAAYPAAVQMPINHSASYQDQYGRVHPVEWYSFGAQRLTIACHTQ